MSATPRVSVIVPTHNRPALLAEALHSIGQQTFNHYEIVVVDDASTPPVTLDGLDEAVRARTRIVRHDSSQGGAAAKNTGIQAARGEIVAFLDDDDLYAPTYLQQALDVLDHHPEVDVVFMGVAWFGANEQWGKAAYLDAMQKILQDAHGVECGADVIVFDDALVGALLKRVPMAFQRPVVRKSAFALIGNYRDHCLLWDCDWATRAALRVRTALLNRGIYRQRVDNQGFSSKHERRLEHLLSGIEIRDTLLKEAQTQPAYRHKIPLFRAAAATAWFDLAYHHYLAGARLFALSAWWQSQKRQFKPARTKLLARLILSLARRASSPTA